LVDTLEHMGPTQGWERVALVRLASRYLVVVEWLQRIATWAIQIFTSAPPRAPKDLGAEQ
jgi:hypothetical protein